MGKKKKKYNIRGALYNSNVPLTHFLSFLASEKMGEKLREKKRLCFVVEMTGPQVL